MTRQLILLFLMMSVSAFIYQSCNTQNRDTNNWPRFRGINGSGVAYPGEDPPIDLESVNNILWKIPLISGASSPCIWGDKIFITGFDKDKQQLQVICLDRLTGQQTWLQMVPAKKIERFHSVGSPADATPVTDGERVYVYFGSYGLLCYDFNGEVIWTRELPVNNDQFGSGTSPILSENLLFLIVRRVDRKERYLLALDKKNGEQVWRQDLMEAGYSTPVIWGDVVIVHGEGFVSGYKINDGGRDWNLLVRTGGESSPVVHDSIIYLNAWHWLGHYHYPGEIPEIPEFLKIYDTNKDDLFSREEFPEQYFPSSRSENDDGSENISKRNKEIWDWFETDQNGFIDTTELQRYINFCVAADQGIIALESGLNGDITENQILWRETQNLAEIPSPLHYKDRIYVIKEGGFFSCINAHTGELLYLNRIKGTGPFFSSPVAANDHIYVCSHNGKVVVLAAGDEFKILSTNNLKEKILATPAIVDNRIYIRTENYLHAFGNGEL